MNEWMNVWIHEYLFAVRTNTDRERYREIETEKERKRVYKLDQLLRVHSLMKQTILHW